MDWQGLAKIHRKIDLGLASDRHWISIGLAWIGKKMDRMILDWSKECPWIGIWLAPDRNLIGPGLAWDWSGIDIWLSQLGMDCTELCRIGIGKEVLLVGVKGWHRIGLELASHWPGLALIGQNYSWLAGIDYNCQCSLPQIHPPNGLGTFPYRALVPRLCAGMASVMAEPLPIRCQSANPVPIGQSGANRSIRCQSTNPICQNWHGLED